MRAKRSFCFIAIVTLTAWLGHTSLASAQEGTVDTRSLKLSFERSVSTKGPAAGGRVDFQRRGIEATDGPLGSRTNVDIAAERKENSTLTNLPQASGGSEGWQLEIRPYLWLAGIDGTLRIRNTTAEVGKGSADVLGMLDFAAAAQVEAIRGNWRLMFDENYVNLGTTGTGPLGNVTIKVEPTMNIFEFGASYMVVAVPNKNATATDPLPPVFSAEIFGGGRFFHLGLGLEPSNGAAVEGSRNLVGPFVGNRFKVSPNKVVTLIGKYTVGGSGAGSQFAWSAEGLVDLRVKKRLSLSGGYRVLGMKADKPENSVGFDGQLRGLIFAATFYR
ncbi:MAG: hypothetical protein ACRD6N_05140 [Pyrinomonadaceae bacterium]